MAQSGSGACEKHCCQGQEWNPLLLSPVWSLDYYENPAIPLIVKVQQDINIIHRLLERALVGYLLEIY